MLITGPLGSDGDDKISLVNFGETNIRALAASAALVTITMLSALMPAALIAPASAA